MVWSENALTRRQTHKRKQDEAKEKQKKRERERERDRRRRRRKRALSRETGDPAFPSLCSAAM
jgi:hypothetical protein